SPPPLGPARGEVGSSLTGIRSRATRGVVVGLFENEEQVEVASLIGDIAVGPDGKPVHAVLGRRDETAMAGHLQEGHVRPTLEIIITESPAHLCKMKDQESGLALIPRPVALHEIENG